MRPVAELLHETFGYTCVGPLLPGHGTTPEELDHTTVEDWLECARAEYQKLSKEYVRVHVAGLSAGGLLCIDLMLQYSEIASAVLLAPAISLRGMQKHIMHAFRHIPLPEFYFGIPKPPSLIPEHIAYRFYPLRATQQFGLLQSRTKKNLRPIHIPTLTIYSAADDTIDDGEIEKIIPFFSSPESRVMKLSRAEHILTQSCEKKTVLDTIVAFHRSLRI